MILRNSAIYIFAVLLLCSSSFADENNNSVSSQTLYTKIQYDDTTGGITGTQTINSKGASVNIFSNLSLTPEQLQIMQQVEQAAQTGQSPPQGYNSWDEFKNAAISNPNIVYLLVQSSSASSKSAAAAYKRAQNAYLVMPTAIQAAGYLNQLNSYDEAFHNTDMLMMMPYKDRIAYKFANKYAVTEYSEHIPTNYQPNIIYSHISRNGANRGMWLRPYVSTGSINFDNGPKADNTMYGVYIGGDSDVHHLKHSDFQYSAYVGYNGSKQKYGENSVNSNGGLLGISGSWYGENAFAALTVNAGANNSQLSTFYMNKDYPMFSTGIAAKTGYNFELADGKFIIQPNYMMSYSFITPFEQGSVAGRPIESKPLNVMNISPGIKFIGNLPHGWQPYAEAKMVWNLFDKTDYSTAYVEIPSISVKPYAQYGIGLQKLWGERSTGYIQFLMRSGGRNEVAFNFGYKCDLGE